MFQREDVLQRDPVTIGRTMPRERRQNGWVEKTGSETKTWTGYWYVYETGPDGVEKRRQRSKVLGDRAAITKGAAEDALRTLIRENRPPESGATFAQLTAWYLKTKAGQWTRDWTVSVESFFKYHILPELGHRVAIEIKPSEVQQAINTIAAKPTCQSGSQIKKCLAQVRAVFESAIDDETFAGRNPARKVSMPPTRRKSERFLELDECARLLEVADQRDNLILRLFMVIGLRPGELFAVRVNDLQPGRLRVDQTVVDSALKDGAKTEGSVAKVPLPSGLEAALRDYIRDEGITDLLFPSDAGTPISPDNYLDRTLKRLGVQAGIDVFENPDGTLNSKLNHQVLRRTTGTHFQKHGEIKDTQTLLRHANAKTTLDNYQKVLQPSLIKAVESWDAQLVPRKGRATKQRRPIKSAR